MLVDAEKVKEKLAKVCEELLEAFCDCGVRIPEAIRQADLSDCAVDDVVPRSRLNAVDAELSEEKTAREFQFRVYKAELESQAAEIERLKEEITSLRRDARQQWNDRWTLE